MYIYIYIYIYIYYWLNCSIAHAPHVRHYIVAMAPFPMRHDIVTLKRHDIVAMGALRSWPVPRSQRPPTVRLRDNRPCAVEQCSSARPKRRTF